MKYRLTITYPNGEVDIKNGYTTFQAAEDDGVAEIAIGATYKIKTYEDGEYDKTDCGC